MPKIILGLSAFWAIKKKKMYMGQKAMLTSPKGFSASKCDEGNWILSKS